MVNYMTRANKLLTEHLINKNELLDNEFIITSYKVALACLKGKEQQ